MLKSNVNAFMSLHGQHFVNTEKWNLGLRIKLKNEKMTE